MFWGGREGGRWTGLPIRVTLKWLPRFKCLVNKGLVTATASKLVLSYSRKPARHPHMDGLTRTANGCEPVLKASRVYKAPAELRDLAKHL